MCNYLHLINVQSKTETIIKYFFFIKMLKIYALFNWQLILSPTLKIIMVPLKTLHLLDHWPSYDKKRRKRDSVGLKNGVSPAKYVACTLAHSQGRDNICKWRWTGDSTRWLHQLIYLDMWIMFWSYCFTSRATWYHKTSDTARRS